MIDVNHYGKMLPYHRTNILQDHVITHFTIGAHTINRFSNQNHLMKEIINAQVITERL